MPVGSLLPAIANWLAPAIRGLFAMAPPPPPLPPPATPCLGIPASRPTSGQLVCGAVPLRPDQAVRLRGSRRRRRHRRANRPTNLSPLPLADFCAASTTRRPIRIRRCRCGRRSRSTTCAATSTTWRGSRHLPGGRLPERQPALGLLQPAGRRPTTTRTASLDPSTIPDRHNQGMFSAIFDKERSVPARSAVPERRVRRHRPVRSRRSRTRAMPTRWIAAAWPTSTRSRASDPTSATGFLDPYPVVPGASRRGELAGRAVRRATRHRLPGGDSPRSGHQAAAALHLRRSSATTRRPRTSGLHARGGRQGSRRRRRPARRSPAPCKDAYNYFVNSVFPPTAPDPAIDCRNYIIVFVTDGHDECSRTRASADPRATAPPATSGAPAPDGSADGGRVPGARARPTRPTRAFGSTAIPGLRRRPELDPYVPGLNCIATNSAARRTPSARARSSAPPTGRNLQGALESILDFKRNAQLLRGAGRARLRRRHGRDTAQIGAVIPSHLNTDGDLSHWSIWSGSLKSFQLDSNGLIPVVTAAGSPTAHAGRPTATPRRRRRRRGRGKLPGRIESGRSGSHGPQAGLERGARARLHRSGGEPGAERRAGRRPSAPTPRQISVWPGRKMVLALGHERRAADPARLLSDSGAGTCPAGCFDDLMAHGSDTDLRAADALKAKLTVAVPARRHHHLRQPRRGPERAERRAAGDPPIGPNAGQEQKYSYFYQDDTPPPGTAPQVQTDGDDEPAGLRAQARRHLPLRAADARAAALLPVPFGEPERLRDLRGVRDFSYRRKRRSSVGANDGFLHAFDAGVWDRDAGGTFPTARRPRHGARDLRLRAGAPSCRASSRLCSTSRRVPQYFVDGSMGKADVFIDPSPATRRGPNRIWRTVLVGGLRQGGNSVWPST